MNTHCTPLRLTLLAAALATALPSYAQQAAAPKAAPVKAAPATLQQVEVKGSTAAYDARRDDTATKIVMNSDEIVKYGDTTVLDVLKRLPGVTVSGASGRGGEVRMRGLGSGYTQILVNGERAPAGFSMDSLAPDSIERIEVIRAATAEFSTQSIAGTINIVLKKAVKKALREFKFGLGVGEGVVSPNYNLQLSDRKGQLSYSFSINGFHNRFQRDTPSVEEGFNAAGSQTLLRNATFFEDGGFDGINIGPRLNWTFDNGDTLTSQTFINLGRFQRDAQAVTTTSIGSGSRYPYVEWDMTNENRFLREDLNWVKKLEGGAKLDLKIGGVIGQLRNDSYRRGYSTRDGVQRLDQYVKSRGTDKGATSTGKYSSPLGEGHALALGWDGGFNTRDDARIQVEQPFPGTIPMNEAQNFTGDVSRLALYGQDEWNVTKNWSVYLGLRWEGINTEVSGSNFVDSSTRSSVFSPLFQTLYKLPGTKGDQLRFAVTRTYKAPNVQSLIPRRFASTNNSATEPDFIGNPDLKPELALGFDASYEHYFAEGAMVSISGTVRKISDYTRNGTFLEADGRWVTKLVNDGNANTRGIELEAKFPLKAVMKNAPAVDLRANFARNWSSVDAVVGPNNRLDAQTPFSATLGADWKKGQLTAGGSYSFRSGGPVRLSVNQSSYTTARRDLEMYVLWKFDAKQQIRFTASNLLEQDFVNETTYQDVTGTLKSRSTSPGTLAMRVQMEVKF
jgi:outer membrane receptor for ferrienterochelin and colicins